MSDCPKQTCQCRSCTLNQKYCLGCTECTEHHFLQPVEHCGRIYGIHADRSELEENIRALIKHSGNEEQICLLYEKAKIEYQLNKTEFSDSYGRIYGMVMEYMFPR